MTDLPESKRAEYRDLAMKHIPLLDRLELSDRRQSCAEGRGPAVIASIEATMGKDTHPPAKEYCPALVRESIRRNLPLGMYGDMALQQSGQGLQANTEGDDKRIGNMDKQILNAVSEAAIAGKATYPDVRGVTRPLPCALAFDAGAISGAVIALRKEPVRMKLSKAQIGVIAEACYSPDARQPTEAMKKVAAEVVKAGDPNGAALAISLNVAGLLAGEALGHAAELEVQTAKPAPAPAKGRPPAKGKQQSDQGSPRAAMTR